MESNGYIIVVPGRPFYSRNETARFVVQCVGAEGVEPLYNVATRLRYVGADDAADTEGRLVGMALDHIWDEDDDLRGVGIPSGLGKGQYILEVEDRDGSDVYGEGEVVVLGTEEHQDFWAEAGGESLVDPVIINNAVELYLSAREQVTDDISEKLRMGRVRVEWLFHDQGVEALAVPRGLFNWAVMNVAERAFDRVCWGGQLLCSLSSEPRRLVFSCLGKREVARRDDQEWIKAMEPFRVALPPKWTVSARDDDDSTEIVLAFEHGMGSPLESLIRIDRVHAPVVEPVGEPEYA